MEPRGLCGVGGGELGGELGGEFGGDGPPPPPPAAKGSLDAPKVPWFDTPREFGAEKSSGSPSRALFDTSPRGSAPPPGVVRLARRREKGVDEAPKSGLSPATAPPPPPKGENRGVPRTRGVCVAAPADPRLPLPGALGVGVRIPLDEPTPWENGYSP